MQATAVRPTTAPVAPSTRVSLTTEEIIQNAEERFAEVRSYRGVLIVTLEPSTIPFMRSVAQVQVGIGAATTIELLDPQTGEPVMHPRMLSVGKDLFIKLDPRQPWATVPVEVKSQTVSQFQFALGEDLQGGFGEPVPLFRSLARLGATFTSSVDPDFEDGEAYTVSFVVHSKQLNESMLKMLRQEGNELAAAVERVAEFRLTGTIWITKTDFLVRSQEVILTSLPGELLLGTARRVESRFIEYDEPVSIERPTSAQLTAADVPADPLPLEPAWSATFGGPQADEAWSVQQTSDGGYIIAGVTKSYGAGERDVYLIKVDEQGKERWSRTYGGSGVDWGYAVQQTSDGGYVVAGKNDSDGAGGGDVYLIKTDSEGKEQWSSSFGGSEWDGAYSVQQTSDGGFILAGKTESYGAGDADVYLIKTDRDGEEQWSRTFGGTGADWASSVGQTSDGGYILSGITRSFGPGLRNVYLIKTDQEGNEQWTRTFGDRSETVVWFVWAARQTSDGGYVVAFVAGGDAYLLKTDGEGNEQWIRSYGGERIDGAWSVQETDDGGYIIVGDTESYGAGGTDIYLVKTDRDGNEQWSSTFGGPRDEFAWSVQQTSDGGYIVAGKTDSYGSGGGDVFLIKINSAGDIIAGRTP